MNSLRKPYLFSARNYNLKLGRRTVIMGIINATPDSFSHDGIYSKNTATSISRVIKLAKTMIKAGANIIDIGGESSKPGSQELSSKEEIKRVIPLIQAITKEFKIPISVDTYKPEVAQRALDAGASIINIIRGITPNINLLKIIKEYRAGIILMHMRGVPKTMQKNIHYKNLIKEIKTSLQKAVEICLEIGIKSDRIIIDPGIGFGKTVVNNLEIINRLGEFAQLGYPILVGTSRKSFIGKILGEEVNNRLYGTLATISASVMNGAHIIRVHDVKEAKETTRIIDAILNKKS